MKNFILLGCALCLFSGSAFAGLFTSTDDRASALRASIEGNDSYHAYMARELISVAEEESTQGDVEVVRAFMNAAETHVKKARGNQ